MICYIVASPAFVRNKVFLVCSIKRIGKSSAKEYDKGYQEEK